MFGNIRWRRVRRGRWTCARSRSRQYTVDQKLCSGHTGDSGWRPRHANQQTDRTLYALIGFQLFLIEPNGTCELFLQPLRGLCSRCVKFKVGTSSRMKRNQRWVDKAAKIKLSGFGYVALPVGGWVNKADPLRASVSP